MSSQEAIETLLSKDPKRQNLGGLIGHRGIVYQLQYAVYKCIVSFCDSEKKIIAVKYQNFTRVDDISLLYIDGKMELYQCKFSLGKIQTPLQQFDSIKEVITDFLMQYIEDYNNDISNREYIICTEDNLKIFNNILIKIPLSYEEGQDYTHLFGEEEKDLFGRLRELIVKIIEEYNKNTAEYNTIIDPAMPLVNMSKGIVSVNEEFLFNFLKKIGIDTINVKTMRSVSISLVNAKMGGGNRESIYYHIFELVAQKPGELINKEEIEKIFNFYNTNNIDVLSENS